MQRLLTVDLQRTAGRKGQCRFLSLHAVLRAVPWLAGQYFFQQQVFQIESAWMEMGYAGHVGGTFKNDRLLGFRYTMEMNTLPLDRAVNDCGKGIWIISTSVNRGHGILLADRFPEFKERMGSMWNRRMVLSGLFITVLAVGQIVLAILFYDSSGNTLVINLGWGVMLLSALFGWLPILTFRKKGEVQGKSYVSTTVLVDSGVYGIVRHPQYLAGVLMSIALAMISQHWLVAGLGAGAALVYYRNTFEEERGCIEKFGEEYAAYMKRVPRLNFLFGLIRLLGGTSQEANE